MARQSPEHLPLGRTPLEQLAIDAYSTAIAARIIAYLSHAPVSIALIPKDMKYGKAAQRQSRFTVQLSAFGQLAQAIERRACEQERHASCEG